MYDQIPSRACIDTSTGNQRFLDYQKVQNGAGTVGTLRKGMWKAKIVSEAWTRR